jgi:hypothetical protein
MMLMRGIEKADEGRSFQTGIPRSIRTSGAGSRLSPHLANSDSVRPSPWFFSRVISFSA